MKTKLFATYPALLALAFSSHLLAQPHRVVRGNIHPKAQLQFDQGPVDSSLRLGSMSLTLKRSRTQQAELDQLLADQQDHKSKAYHKWLTPEQFAGRFGASQADVDKLTNWLQSNGFTVDQVARGRDYISFSGTATQVEHALHTQIHHYRVNGKTHFANASDPSLPDDLATLVAGIRGLDDFKPLPPKRVKNIRAMKIDSTATHPDFYTTSYPNTNVLAPDDLATIYNVNSLYNAGIDGKGQRIAVAGESDIYMEDIEYFRKVFGLPYNDPKKVLVPGSKNPGIVLEVMGEADLDLEWAGAIARNATIYYVYSEDAFASAFYAIDQAIAPVLSFSFGACELDMTPNDVDLLRSEAQKAASEGITWLVSSGDSGASGCENQGGDSSLAVTRASVDLPASLPEVTAVGGSEFNEGSGNYWASKLRSNGGSALSYIPERGWSDEALIMQYGASGFASGGGGRSFYFGKPSWQTGRGVPNDGARDVPDISLTASGEHDPYALITNGEFSPSGGTSASAPSFAGIVALLNQYLMARGDISEPGLGTMNPMLYALAESAPNAFHDITVGSNIVPCAVGSSPDCKTGSYGYTAGPGYDQVTGLGSVDAYTLAMEWDAAVSGSPRLVIRQFTASTTAHAGGSFSLTLKVENTGNADAGEFQTAAYFTTNGDLSTKSKYYVYCTTKGLAAGDTSTCSGTVTLGSSITPGTYLLVAVADVNDEVPQDDRSGNVKAASTGKLTVTK